MKSIRQSILVLFAVLALFVPAVPAEQSQKAARPNQDDRIKRLEERADAAEKAASSPAMEREYLERSQSLTESYYQRAFNTEMLTLGMVGIILIATFGLVARFSVNMLNERAKMATTDAVAQMRNEHGRTLAREVQKLWDSNTADIKKLKETLTAQIAQFEQNLKDASEFQTHFLLGLAAGGDRRYDDSVTIFRNALSTYKSGKSRGLAETRVGAAAIRHVFESLRKANEGQHVEKARLELADALYNDLEEELALAAVQSPWLTPLVAEKRPAAPEPPAPEPIVEKRSVALISDASFNESDFALGEEADSCRLITT